MLELHMVSRLKDGGPAYILIYIVTYFRVRVWVGFSVVKRAFS